MWSGTRACRPEGLLIGHIPKWAMPPAPDMLDGLFVCDNTSLLDDCSWDLPSFSPAISFRSCGSVAAHEGGHDMEITRRSFAAGAAAAVATAGLPLPALSLEASPAQVLSPDVVEWRARFRDLFQTWWEAHLRMVEVETAGSTTTMHSWSGPMSMMRPRWPIAISTTAISSSCTIPARRTTSASAGWPSPCATSKSTATRRCKS